MEENLPPGFRFHPTDEELITYYLTNKVSDFTFSSRAIADVDLNKCEPWDLPAKASMGEKEWYFFSLRDRKYPTGMRTNRATEAGYWKTTGKDKEIFRGGLVLVGMKKTLVFYKGRAPKGEKTNWVMHEYRLEAKLGFKPSKEEWVVCRIFQKSTTVKKPQQTPSSPHDSMESPYNCDTNPIIMANELGDIELPNSSSSAGGGNIINTFSNLNYNDNNVNLNMTNTNDNNVLNWSTALREAAANVLPSTFLNPTTSPMNPFLLRALQLSTYHQSPAMAAAAAVPRDYASLMSQGINYSNHFGNNDLIISSNLGGSSRVNVLDQQQQEAHHHQQQEQPFNLDSDENIW